MPNLVGETFGRLTIVMPTNLRSNGSIIWICKCICNNVIDVPTYNLTRGHTQSCGCLKSENASVVSKKYHKLPDNEAVLHRVYNVYKNSAKKRNLDFRLSLSEVKELIFCKCYYCDSDPSNTQIFNKRSTGIPYSGIDRVDNSKGYFIGNVVPCCKECNFLKQRVPIFIAKRMMEFSYAY